MGASSETGGSNGAIRSPPSSASSPRARPCPSPTEARSATWPTSSVASPNQGAMAERQHLAGRSPSSPVTTRCSPTTARSTRSCAPSPRARGDGRARDAALAAELEADAKERAEHVMIVDLERNDLGRVAAIGSVGVEAYARVESHPTVHHLVSSVVGRVRPDVGLAQLLRAAFPGGSITGAPKVRAMEIIRELEPVPRGAYTGAFGLFHPSGDLELGLAIRTAVVSTGVVRYHAGGGIVGDSDPERELAEAWLKTAALRLALGEDARPELERCSSG